jgi:molybdopterin molybdotransferase
MLPIEEARRTVFDRCSVLPTVSIHVHDATRSVLAADAVATEDVPPFANTAVDGYAVRSADQFVCASPVRSPRVRPAT